MTAETKVFCFDGRAGEDPHAVVLTLSATDVERWNRVRDREKHLAVFATGEFVAVTDQASGERYRVASAPCGARCHCAAVAEKIA